MCRPTTATYDLDREATAPRSRSLRRGRLVAQYRALSARGQLTCAGVMTRARAVRVRLRNITRTHPMIPLGRSVRFVTPPDGRTLGAGGSLDIPLDQRVQDA